MTHQAERSERVIEGKPKAKLSFCALTILFSSLCAGMEIGPRMWWGVNVVNENYGYFVWVVSYLGFECVCVLGSFRVVVQTNSQVQRLHTNPHRHRFRWLQAFIVNLKTGEAKHWRRENKIWSWNWRTDMCTDGSCKVGRWQTSLYITPFKNIALSVNISACLSHVDRFSLPLVVDEQLKPQQELQVKSKPNCGKAKNNSAS